MTRLIDADELKSVFTEKSTEAVCGAELCKAIISRIDDTRTVDAIPISFINQLVELSRKVCADYHAESLEILLRDWAERKEE